MSVPPRLRSAVRPALATVVLLGLAGCASTVEITSTLDDEERVACEALVDDLPEEFFDQARVEVSGDGVGAAWGDPPVVLTCGADAPEEFNAFARCSEIEGVGWFIPDAQMKDFESEVTMTAQSHSPRVRVDIPAEHRDKGPDTWLAVLAGPVTEHLTEVKPCR